VIIALKAKEQEAEVELIVNNHIYFVLLLY